MSDSRTVSLRLERSVRFVLCALLCIFISGCSREPQVIVINESASPLENLTVSGTGFLERAGRLEPGQRTQLTVAPKGESGLRLEFDANGSHHSPPEDGYFEANGGSHVTVRVKADFSVKTEVRL